MKFINYYRKYFITDKFFIILLCLNPKIVYKYIYYYVNTNFVEKFTSDGSNDSAKLTN
jgi:hypothetical protein